MREDIFKVFGDERLGRIFVPDGSSYEGLVSLHVSPIHGRAVAVKIGDFDWLSVKGGGWNYGGPQIYISAKDEELIFGLYPRSSALRELAVSQEINKISDEFPKVLYYKRIADVQLPLEYSFLNKLTFSNGSAVDPCILYTQVKSPFRVADLIYLTAEEKQSVIGQCCKYWGITYNEYTKKFIRKLAENVAILHKNGFINDTLDYGNVTLLSEIVDYEWITAPGIRLPNGTFGIEITEERKEKEVLYGAEICLQLKALLHEKYNLFDIYEEFIDAYSRINTDFVDNNLRIQKIINKELYIL